MNEKNFNELLLLIITSTAVYFVGLIILAKEVDGLFAIREIQAGRIPTHCIFEENCVFSKEELKDIGVKIQYVKQKKEQK